MATQTPKEDFIKPTKIVDENDDDDTESDWSFYLPILICLCFVAFAGFLVYMFWGVFVEYLFESLEKAEHKAMQALVINTVLVIMIVCCLPGPAFCVILDGFFFGFVKGFMLGFIAELIGYLICLFLARTCFRARLRQWVLESAMLAEVLAVCEEDSSGKFLVLFRFISMPVWVKNYTIGMLDLPWHEAILVFIPAETFYAGIFSYIGSRSYIMADAIRKGNTQKVVDSFSGVEVAIVVVSLLVTVLIVLFGWFEFSRRRTALAEGARSESAPIAGPLKAVV